MSDLTKKWWETSDLKKNAWNLWSDSSGAQLAPGLKSLRLPRALRSAPLTRAAIENDVWQHRRQCRRAPHARTHLDKGIISRQCRMRRCRLWTHNCTQNKSPGLVHTADTLTPCVPACSCVLLRVCAIYTYSKELCDVRVYLNRLHNTCRLHVRARGKGKPTR